MSSQNYFSQDREARGEQIVCLGDARHDSPGFTACWCTYAVLVCKLQLYGPMYTIVHNIFTGCCNWTGRLLLDSAQRPGNLKLKYVNHLAVYIRWDRVRPWSQRVLRPLWVCVTLLDLRTTQHYNLYPGCLKREGVNVSVFATDRSTSVRCVS